MKKLFKKIELVLVLVHNFQNELVEFHFHNKLIKVHQIKIRINYLGIE